MSFAPRQKVHARLRGQFRNAVIEEVETCADTGDVRYYVHWPEHDRRMDAWVSQADVRIVAAPAAKSAKQASKLVSTIRTRSGRAAAAASADRDTSQPDENLMDDVSVGSSPAALLASRVPQQGGSKASLIQRPDHSRPQDSKFFSRARNIRAFVIGDVEVDAWYFTPLPLAHVGTRLALEECAQDAAVSASSAIRVSSSPAPSPASPSVALRSSTLVVHVCPFCLESFADHGALEHGHLPVCLRRPPGREVYRDTERQVIVFEADGATHRTYAERLALLSKAFLEHKTLDYDTTPFVFYTLCVVTSLGCQVAGYFSREKRNPENFNLSCILTFPQYQGRGFGRFLVELSYEMSRREGRVGSPEKPLSDLGEKTYYTFWKETVLDALLAHRHLEGTPIRLEDIMRTTGMTQADVLWALRALKMIDARSEIVLHLPASLVAAHLEVKVRRMERGDVRFQPCCLAWRASDYRLVTMMRDELLQVTTIDPLRPPGEVVRTIGEKRVRPSSFT